MLPHACLPLACSCCCRHEYNVQAKKAKSSIGEKNNESNKQQNTENLTTQIKVEPVEESYKSDKTQNFEYPKISESFSFSNKRIKIEPLEETSKSGNTVNVNSPISSELSVTPSTLNKTNCNFDNTDKFVVQNKLSLDGERKDKSHRIFDKTNEVNKEGISSNTVVSAILQRFHNVNLTINKDGKVSALLPCPLNTLSELETKMLAQILEHAQTQVEELRLSSSDKEIQLSSSLINKNKMNIFASANDPLLRKNTIKSELQDDDQYSSVNFAGTDFWQSVKESDNSPFSRQKNENILIPNTSFKSFTNEISKNVDSNDQQIPEELKLLAKIFKSSTEPKETLQDNNKLLLIEVDGNVLNKQVTTGNDEIHFVQIPMEVEHNLNNEIKIEIEEPELQLPDSIETNVISCNVSPSSLPASTSLTPAGLIHNDSQVLIEATCEDSDKECILGA